jgi:hypothetical protein
LVLIFRFYWWARELVRVRFCDDHCHWLAPWFYPLSWFVPPCSNPMLSWVLFGSVFEVRKVHVERVYIRTPAYSDLRNVSTVKKLLELRIFTGRRFVERR